MNDTKILLVNDLPGYGKVALLAMMPILSKFGHNLHTLPTALVSNTLDYEKFEILDTTQYMSNSLKVWDELGFSFDYLCSGFIASPEQAQMIANYIASREDDLYTLVDPIMGDDGKLYNGMDENTVESMRLLCSRANCVIPNVTEAKLITGLNPANTVMSTAEIDSLINTLRDLGPQSVVITSIQTKEGFAVCGWDGSCNQAFRLPYDHIDVRFPGTGDIFSAVLLDSIIKGQPLTSGTQRAMDAVRTLIMKQKNAANAFEGIAVERYLDLL